MKIILSLFLCLSALHCASPASTNVAVGDLPSTNAIATTDKLLSIVHTGLVRQITVGNLMSNYTASATSNGFDYATDYLMGTRAGSSVPFRFVAGWMFQGAPPLAWEMVYDGLAGVRGFVPAPTAGNETKFLRGDATWGEIASGLGLVRVGTGDDLPTVYAAVDEGTTLWLEPGTHVTTAITAFRRVNFYLPPGARLCSSGANGKIFQATTDTSAGDDWTPYFTVAGPGGLYADGDILNSYANATACTIDVGEMVSTNGFILNAGYWARITLRTAMPMRGAIAGQQTRRDQAPFSLTLSAPSLICTNTNAPAVWLVGSNCFATINVGTIISSNSAAMNINSGANVIGFGNVIGWGTDAMACRTGSVVRWHGDIITDGDCGLLLEEGIDICVWGNVKSLGGYAAGSGWCLAGGKVGVMNGATIGSRAKIYGDVYGYFPLVTELGITEVYGNCYTSSNTPPIYLLYQNEPQYNNTTYIPPDVERLCFTGSMVIGSGTNRHYGNIYATTNHAVSVRGSGRVELYNSHVRSDTAPAIYLRSGNVWMYNTSASTGATTNSILSTNAQTVYVMGGLYTNQPPSATVTVTRY